MRPYVHSFVGKIESGLDAVDLVLRETVAFDDVGVDSPWVREVFVCLE